MSWKIDPAHSEINFAVRHMMISTVRGRFDNFEGTVEFDPENPENSLIDVSIDANSVNTREAQRDGHLRSPDFLNVEKYPTIHFQSKRIEVLDQNRATVHGELTIKNISRPVILETEYNGLSKSPWGTTAAGFSARTKLNRKDWDLTWNVALETGGWLVSDEIQVNIEVELVKQVEAELVR